MAQFEKKPYDLWAEVPSPVKTKLRRAFASYAGVCFQEGTPPMTAYIPAQLGGNMAAEDYLSFMRPEELPDACLLMNFGECSEAVFASMAQEIYEKPEIAAWFPEVLVADLRRLDGRKIPETYGELLDASYGKEICLIGSAKMPDPLAGLYFLRTYGEEGLKQFAQKVSSFAPPSETIRHIGKPSNSYGTLFLMPPLFAQICLEKKAAKIILPKRGALAEPMLLYQKKSAPSKERIHAFFHSPFFQEPMAEYQMPGFGDSRFRIDASCRQLASEEELKKVFEAFHQT